MALNDIKTAKMDIEPALIVDEVQANSGTDLTYHH
jgi:hypothetical protein